MIQTLQLILITLLIACFISCNEMRQDIYFNEDGSGKIQFKMSMDGETIQLLSMMANEGSEESSESVNTIFNEMKDTTMVLYEIIPDSIKNQYDELDYLKNWVFSFSIDSIAQTMGFDVSISYQSLKELRDAMKDLQSMTLGDDLAAGAGSSSLGGLIDTSFTWEPGHIYWESTDLINNPEYEKMLDEMGGEEGEGALEMLEMFMGDLTFEMVIHAPGEIYKCECPFGRAEGNKAIMLYKLIDVFKNIEEFNKDTHIYYKE